MRWKSQSISRPYVETFSGSHQSSMLAEPPGSYFFISIATFVACPALTSTSFVCLPSVSCQASTVYLPGGTFSILVLPPPSVTPKNGFGMTATHPSIQLWTSQVSLTISGFSSFSVITFLNFGWALLMDGFAVEYVWMLCRMSSEFLSSSSPGVIAVTCGTNLQPCWSTVAFTAFGAPLAPGTDTTACASPLLGPTTTFSITASVPHFSVSLFTLSFSTTAAPASVTAASMVPPPCAPAGPGRWATAATPATSAIARNAPITLRIALVPPEFEVCSPVRDSHHEQHHRQCEDCDDRRNDETSVRLRLLQPQIVP